MADNKTRYRQIRNYLDKAFPTQPKGNVARYLNTLAAIISGIVGSGSCQLPKIASKIPENVNVGSVEKRIKRWLDNQNIEGDIYFMPFAQALLLSLGLQEIFLVMDGSVVGRGCVTLMLNVIYKKRALPIAYIVIEGKKGHFSEECHITLLETVHDIIPDYVQQVVFLGDGEFDGVGLLQKLQSWGWKYVCRTARNIKFYMDDEEFEIEIIGFLHPQGYCHGVKDVLFTNKKYGPVTLIVWWEEGHQEAIYLVTNLKSAEIACDYYSKRFKIETFFSDQKSRGFNLHKSHLSDPMRLARLLIGACLAYIWIVFLGTIAVEQGWINIIHRRKRCDLSLFQAGLRLLEYFLDHDISVPVSFKMLNPSV